MRLESLTVDQPYGVNAVQSRREALPMNQSGKPGYPVAALGRAPAPPFLEMT